MVILDVSITLADKLQSLLFGATSQEFQFSFGTDDKVDDESLGVKQTNQMSASSPLTPPRSPSLLLHGFKLVTHDSDGSWEHQSEPSKLEELLSPSSIHASKCLYSH